MTKTTTERCPSHPFTLLRADGSCVTCANRANVSPPSGGVVSNRPDKHSKAWLEDKDPPARVLRKGLIERERRVSKAAILRANKAAP